MSFITILYPRSFIPLQTRIWPHLRPSSWHNHTDSISGLLRKVARLIYCMFCIPGNGSVSQHYQGSCCKAAVEIGSLCLKPWANTSESLKYGEELLRDGKTCSTFLSLYQNILMGFLRRLDSMKVISRLCTHRQTCRALFDLVGSQDIPGPHRIFKNAKRDGWSTKKLLKTAQMALEDKYFVQVVIRTLS